MLEMSRRKFLKVSASTLAGSSLAALGFSLAPALAEVRQYKLSKLSRTTETRNTCPHCSVGCGILMYGLGDNAKNTKASIIQHRRRSRPPGQSRHAVPEGCVVDRLHPQPQPVDASRVSRPRLARVETHLVGRLARPHRRIDEAGPRCEFRREDAGRQDGQPLADHWLPRGLGGQQRSRLSHTQDCTQSWDARVRQSGACLTWPDGGRSCPDVWPWNDDEPLGRHQEHGRDHGDERQRSRGAPVRFQVGDRGEGAPETKLIVVDPRFTRTASVADFYAPIRTGSDIMLLGGVINYLLTHDKIQHEYVKNYTDMSFIVREETSRSRTDCSRVTTRKSANTTRAPGITRRATTVSSRSTRRFSIRARLQPDEAALRHTPEMVSKVCGTPQTSSSRSARCSPRPPRPIAGGRFSTRSAGRITPLARR